MGGGHLPAASPDHYPGLGLFILDLRRLAAFVSLICSLRFDDLASELFWAEECCHIPLQTKNASGGGGGALLQRLWIWGVSVETAEPSWSLRNVLKRICNAPRCVTKVNIHGLEFIRHSRSIAGSKVRLGGPAAIH